MERLSVICAGNATQFSHFAGVALPATQLMPSAPWKVPVPALDTEAVKAGVRAIITRRPKNYPDLQALTTPRLLGL